MILVTGHRGFIGQHLTNKIKEEWVGYDLVDGLDIRNLFRLEQYFKDYQPSVVIHLAALAGVRF